MSNKRKIISLIICGLALSMFLTSCAKPNAEQESKPSEENDAFTPAVDEGEKSELYKRYAQYEKNAASAFKSNSPLGASSFEYEISGDEIKINKYIGSEPIIIIPEKIDGKTVTEIAEAAFSGGVRAVYIPDSVKAIAGGAFDGCEGLSTLRLPFVGDGGDNEFLGYIFGADEPDENAVAVPPSLDMVIVGKNCKKIGDEAFRRAKTLSAVVFEGEIESLGKLAFYECADLVYITLEKVSKSIGELSFAFCSSLYSADVSNCSSVADGAFYMCSKLNTIGVTLEKNDFLGRYFGAESFDYNEDFVPLSLRCVNIGDGTEKIPDKAFGNCRYITEVSLPASLEVIGIRAFYACRSLGAVIIPDGVKKIEDDAFFGCDSVKTLELGKSLESIGMQAFYGCSSVKGVTCPKSLKEIGAWSFYGCSSLASVSLGGVKRIGKDAFGNCQRLEPLELGGIEVET